MSGTNSRIPLSTPNVLTPKLQSIISGGVSHSGLVWYSTPALLCRMSSPPKADRTNVPSSATEAASDTSATAKRMSPPVEAASRSAAAAAFDSLMSAMTTRAPSLSSASATP